MNIKRGNDIINPGKGNEGKLAERLWLYPKGRKQQEDRGYDDNYFRGLTSEKQSLKRNNQGRIVKQYIQID